MYDFVEAELAKENPTFVPSAPIRLVRDEGMLKLAEVLKVPAVRITYTVSGDEPIHPDPSVRARMREIGLNNDCGYGCKVYADPLSNVRVLAHNRSYGCQQ